MRRINIFVVQIHSFFENLDLEHLLSMMKLLKMSKIIDKQYLLKSLSIKVTQQKKNNYLRTWVGPVKKKIGGGLYFWENSTMKKH